MSAPALMAQTNELLDLACREFDDPDAVADLKRNPCAARRTVTRCNSGQGQGGKVHAA